jgi:hypothetical protein
MRNEIKLASIELASRLAQSGRLLGALSLLLRESAINSEDRFIAADIMLRQASVDDFENWASFNPILLQQFEKSLSLARIDTGIFLEKWVLSVREIGLGISNSFFIKRLREGLSSASNASISTFAGAALDLLEFDGQHLGKPLENYGLTNPDVFLLMRRFHDFGRHQAALLLSELRLRNSNGQSMWDHYWHSQILISLGKHGAAFEALCKFLQIASTDNDIRNGLLKAMALIPYCEQMNSCLSKIRELVNNRFELDVELNRLERLIDDIEKFHTQTHITKSVLVGRKYYSNSELHIIENDLLREIRIDPSASSYYELAKISSMFGNNSSARELLLTATGLDARFFG